MTPIRKRMLKTGKEFFSEKQIDNYVRKWLEKYPYDCPWPGSDKKCTICVAMFSNVKRTKRIDSNCPCYAFGADYTIKRVKEALK